MTTLPIELTPTLLASIAGTLLSLSFNYIPGWRVYYGKLSSETKALIMLCVLILTTLILYILVAVGALAPTQEVNAWSFLWMLIFSVSTNQITYSITPLPNDVRTAKAQRTPIKNGTSDAG